MYGFGFNNAVLFFSSRRTTGDDASAGILAASVGAVKIQCAVGFKSRRIGRREAVECSVGWDGHFIQMV